MLPNFTTGNTHISRSNPVWFGDIRSMLVLLTLAQQHSIDLIHSINYLFRLACHWNMGKIIQITATFVIFQNISSTFNHSIVRFQSEPKSETSQSRPGSSGRSTQSLAAEVAFKLYLSVCPPTPLCVWVIILYYIAVFQLTFTYKTYSTRVDRTYNATPKLDVSI